MKKAIERNILAIIIIFIGTFISHMFEIHGFPIHPWVTTTAFVTGLFCGKIK